MLTFVYYISGISQTGASISGNNVSRFGRRILPRPGAMVRRARRGATSTVHW